MCDRQRKGKIRKGCRAMKIYANYKDDGPDGMCGQSGDQCSKWNKLYIFDDMDKYRIWVDSVPKYNRLNSRVVWTWIYDNDAGYNDVIDTRTIQEGE